MCHFNHFLQVFRLVTDETVEVKVVERAQQKLKLDAMVVQQGRLQDTDKKMSKQDLLETLRFGAEKIFKSKDSTITDEDIDLILQQGRKRTEEMNSKLQVAEKGDMYDFRLDGGLSTQVCFIYICVYILSIEYCNLLYFNFFWGGS